MLADGPARCKLRCQIWTHQRWNDVQSKAHLQDEIGGLGADPIMLLAVCPARCELLRQIQDSRCICWRFYSLGNLQNVLNLWTAQSLCISWAVLVGGEGCRMVMQCVWRSVEQLMQLCWKQAYTHCWVKMPLAGLSLALCCQAGEVLWAAFSGWGKICLLCAPIASILCLTIFAPSLAVTPSSLNQCFVASLNAAAQVTH